MLIVAFVVALLTASCSGARLPATSRPARGAETSPKVITISVTITPSATDSGLEVSDADRLEGCQAMLTHLEVEYAMRYDDGQVTHASFSLERGEQFNNPHLQAMYDLRLDAATSTEEIKRLVRQEKAWLKGIITAANDMHVRLSVKRYKDKDREYGYGYTLKDTGQSHFANFNFGFTNAELKDLLDRYRAKATGCAFSSNKMNKNPASAQKQIAFKVTNLFVLTAWFIKDHGLQGISRYLSLALVIAYALETTKYRVDDSLILGRSGGAALDPVRTQALFELSTSANASKPSETVPLIETVLYGAVQPNDTRFDAECLAAGLPTPKDIKAHLNLAAARRVCAEFTAAQPDAMPTAHNGGHFLVIDFLGTSAAREAAATMTQAGLTGSALLSTDQLPNACGYLAARWACMARELGQDFHSLTMDDASSVNTPEMIDEANVVLELEGTDALWLADNQIIQLASIHNPDQNGADPSWMSGPGPLNMWRAQFTTSVASPHLHGQVMIYVVNSISLHSLTATPVGAHWFLVIWLIEPADAHGAAGEMAHP